MGRLRVVMMVMWMKDGDLWKMVIDVGDDRSQWNRWKDGGGFVRRC